MVLIVWKWACFCTLCITRNTHGRRESKWGMMLLNEKASISSFHVCFSTQADQYFSVLLCCTTCNRLFHHPPFPTSDALAGINQAANPFQTQSQWAKNCNELEALTHLIQGEMEDEKKNE